jgi:CHAT domain-containing protein
MHVALTITETNGYYTYILEGIGSQLIELTYSGLSEPVENIRYWMRGFNFCGNIDLLNLTRGDERFKFQQRKKVLTELGSFIYQNLLPPQIANILKNNEVHYISLKIGKTLNDIPWEFMFDGDNFFFMKYAIGRLVDSKSQINDLHSHDTSKRFLLVQDPSLTLEGGFHEINILIGNLQQFPEVKITQGGKEMRKRDFINTLRNQKFNVLHFTGHGSFDINDSSKSSLLFNDGPCYAYEIAQGLGGNSPPLIFCNACTSAQTSSGQEGLINAFLSNGTSAYIGTIWSIEDELAKDISSDFYRYIIHGKTIGEAMRIVRLDSFEKYRWKSIDWAAYILYGDPAIRIF